MSPKQQRGEATVERLLTTALRVYADSGRQGFTVNAVTAASGVSLYHHFGSFDGLAAAPYIRCTEQLYGEVVAGPAAETARRWLCGAHDVDLARATRILPDRVWRSLRPE
ncbi:TetR/AcrR family transcriptional regulator [Streptomyces sp. Qhu_M48]|uniref:TetR/AcrR family transcriptional regulator n=1 Tax=Streptomyces sp. Qhu_M48 TaxID=3435889 RepID=UPI003F4F709F